MVSKKNFQNGRPMPYKKPFKGGPAGAVQQNMNNMMFNASQLPDSGFMDFNDPPQNKMMSNNNNTNAGQGQQKKKNNKNKQRNKNNLQQQQQPSQQQHQMQGPQNGGGGPNAGGKWNKNKSFPQPTGGFNKFNGPQRNFAPMQGRPPRMMMGAGSGAGFEPLFSRRPMPPMVPPLFVRRSGRPMPPPIPPMMPPHMPPHANGWMPPMHPMPMMPPMAGSRGPLPPPFAGPGKIKKPNPKTVKKVVKGKSNIKTLKNLVNQYPLDKVWVTDAIRAEHAAKVDIENRLKGNKDDELFAQFKQQRDKFVAMYEATREEYLKKEAEKVKAAKEAKDKDGNNKEATPKKNVKS